MLGVELLVRAEAVKSACPSCTVPEEEGLGWSWSAQRSHYSEGSLWEHSALGRGGRCPRVCSLPVPALPGAGPGSSGLCPSLPQEQGDAARAAALDGLFENPQLGGFQLGSQ